MNSKLKFCLKQCDYFRENVCWGSLISVQSNYPPQVKFSSVESSPVTMRVENFKVPGGEEETIAIANREVTRLKQQITYLVKDGLSFPALQEIERLQTLPDPNGVFKDLARAQARVKVDEISKVLSEPEAACSI